MGLIAEEQFNMTPSSSTVYLAGTTRAGTTSSIVAGVTLLQNLEVIGNLYINGWNVRNHPNTDLTAYYNITPYGQFTATSSFGFTNTNYGIYTSTNFAIAHDLGKMFSTSTYLNGSEVSVLCVNNTVTSVRKFELQAIYGPKRWEPKESYAYTWTSTTTATIGPAVSWLWTTATNTNIVLQGY